MDWGSIPLLNHLTSPAKPLGNPRSIRDRLEACPTWVNANSAHSSTASFRFEASLIWLRLEEAFQFGIENCPAACDARRTMNAMNATTLHCHSCGAARLWRQAQVRALRCAAGQRFLSGVLRDDVSRLQVLAALRQPGRSMAGRRFQASLSRVPDFHAPRRSGRHPAARMREVLRAVARLRDV